MSSRAPGWTWWQLRSGCGRRARAAWRAGCPDPVRCSARAPRSMSCWATWCGACSRDCTCARSRADPRPHPRMDLQELATVYRSRRRRDCDERLLVLTALDIPGWVVPGEGEFVLLV